MLHFSITFLLLNFYSLLKLFLVRKNMEIFFRLTFFYLFLHITVIIWTLYEIVFICFVILITY